VPEGLPQEALGPIAGHGPSDLARRGQADPAEGLAVHAGYENEERAVEPDSLAERLPEIGTPDEPLGRAQPRAGWRGHPWSGPDPLAPLLAPPLQYEAAALGAHAHEETVGPLPLPVVGLEGPFHGCRLWPRTSAPDGPRLPWAKVQVYSPLVFPVNPAPPRGVSKHCLRWCRVVPLSGLPRGTRQPFLALEAAGFPQVLKSLCKKGFVGRLSLWRPAA
jgi:hypothetical protein